MSKSAEGDALLTFPLLNKGFEAYSSESNIFVTKYS
jgi:hypothetical protein